MKDPERKDKDLLRAVGSQHRDAESRKQGRGMGRSATEKCHHSGRW